MTLTDRILLFVDENPGLTAWSISKGLSETPELDKRSISSILNRLAKLGHVVRIKGMRGSWRYFPKEV